ncbi:hypothetical protein RhiirC2_81517 [Rhizophagus irregularis]|uniref:Uncharacterized protein n=1 Tax=Rhizophagus irregularis TaxID=588596 RepID=A0A2N1MTT7_9GLOM|nr:hypothetical protein RhiirC2_81517 [Rhizophagus irregularis]
MNSYIIFVLFNVLLFQVLPVRWKKESHIRKKKKFDRNFRIPISLKRNSELFFKKKNFPFFISFFPQIIFIYFFSSAKASTTLIQFFVLRCTFLFRIPNI